MGGVYNVVLEGLPSCVWEPVLQDKQNTPFQLVDKLSAETNWRIVSSTRFISQKFLLERKNLL